jgi:hypothetical protein
MSENLNQLTMTSFKFAGLGDVTCVGMSVKSAVDRMLRLAYVERRLMFLAAAHLGPVPERDLKLLLGRLQYHAGERCQAFRERLRQMRTPKSRIEAVPDARLEILMDEALLSAGSQEIAETVWWLHCELQSAYQDYLKMTNPLADAPSCDAIEAALPRLSSAIGWLDGYLNHLGMNVQSRATCRRLEKFLRSAGGLDGTGEKPEVKVERERSMQPFRAQRAAGRDATFERVWDYIKPPTEDVADHLVYMLGIRLSEINVAEGLAVVLCDTPGMPWEFYHDLSRHLWDEVRHSMMGQAAIEVTFGNVRAIPMRDYESLYCMEAPALEQYATLGLEIEGAQMKYPVGKRGEWEFCRDAARHVLMTTFQDYDWADEVLHVNIAKRQLAEWAPGDAKALSAIAEEGKANRTKVKQRHVPVLLNAPPDTLERAQRSNFSLLTAGRETTEK